MRMSNYNTVVKHIERILNKYGDNVRLQTTGNTAFANSDISIEIKTITIKKENRAFKISKPENSIKETDDDRYYVNRIRISKSMIDDYSNGSPFSEKELISIISKKQTLFAYFE